MIDGWECMEYMRMNIGKILEIVSIVLNSVEKCLKLTVLLLSESMLNFVYLVRNPKKIVENRSDVVSTQNY